MKDYIIKNFQDTAEIMAKLLENTTLITNLEFAANQCVMGLKNHKKILIAGNGGSAADAQHIAGELVSRFYFDRPGLPAIALTTDTSILTAIGNDYGYENVFSRQIQALGIPGDIFIAYSTSGCSKNIIRALEIAKEKQLITIGFSGLGIGPMHDLCDILLPAPSHSTPKIQEVHLVLGHILCGLIENEIFGECQSKHLLQQREHA
jgi:D-sedoheptulose 7-phosphate isomerase